MDALLRRLDRKRDDIDPETLSSLVKSLEDAGINPRGRQLQQLNEQAAELRKQDSAPVDAGAQPYRSYGEDYLNEVSLSGEVSRQNSQGSAAGEGSRPPSRAASGALSSPGRSPRSSGENSNRSIDDQAGSGRSNRFKAAARTAVFVNRMKRGVQFSESKEVRKFVRSSSFWDHEYWDEDAELESSGSDKLTNSIRLRAAAKAWFKEWEAKLTVMPSQGELEAACDKLIEMWLDSGFTSMWFMNGLEDGIESFCGRLQRHPYIALMTLAKLCQRPDSFFMESENRKEAALGTLYDRLHLLQYPDSGSNGSSSSGGSTHSRGWTRFNEKLGDWGDRFRRKLKRGLGLG